MPQEIEAPRCKLRFKGVENFLRRVAFNLGNTPSQTEVKIISCIPIDVTDLQQKIIQLEKQLENSQKANEEHIKDDVDQNGKKTTADNFQEPTNETQKPPNESPKQVSIVHTAMCTNTLPKNSKLAIRTETFDCGVSTNTELFENKSSKPRNSTMSFIFPTAPSIKPIHPASHSKKSNFLNSVGCSTVTKEIRQHIFRKNKRFPKKKMNSQLVYYTKIDNTPFLSHGISHTAKNVAYGGSDSLKRSYLFNMMRKQYESNQVLDEFSNTSNFTTPICKDVEQNFQRYYDTDMCSCCHGTFQNIDDYLSKGEFNTYSVIALNPNDYRNTYYDSSLYDLIPVKEKPVKHRKEFDTPKRKEIKIDIKCWPEDVRVKSRPKVDNINYQNTIHNKKNHTRKVHVNVNGRKENNTVVSIKSTKYSKNPEQQTRMRSSKNFVKNYSNLNKEPSGQVKTIKLSEELMPVVKNIDRVTTNISHSECQTSTLNTITTSPENKTEVTLNQIKCILQSVLTEVKTTSQVKHNEEKTKKDAVVQNEVSQNNMCDRSRLLKSFTYSPYNVSPYEPSCSKQMPTNCFCYPKLPYLVNYMQNHPLIIQGTEPHVCTGCYRNSHIKADRNAAITASTNTERNQQYRNNETEILIQEIYKSVALGIPAKETFLSEYDELKSIKETYSNNLSKQSEDIRDAISELFTNRNVQTDTSKTNDTNSTIRSKTVKTESTQSRPISTDTGIDNRITQENTKIFSTQKPFQQTTETEPETEREIKSYHAEPKRRASSTVSENSETEYSRETESVESDVATKDTQVKKKTGILSRIFQVFNKNKNSRNINKVNEPEDPDVSDSDDYQTVYSHKSEIPNHDKSIHRKSLPHSKIFHSRRVQQRRSEKPRKIPYLEQEYRRLWNEKLMFYNQKRRYPSENPFQVETDPKERPQHSYNHDYEVRSVLVEPKRMYSYQTKNPLEKSAANNSVHKSRIPQGPNLAQYNTNNGPCNTRANTQHTVPTFYKGYQVTTPAFENARPEKITEPKSPRDKTAIDSRKPKNQSWFAKHKMGLRCGKQWKQLLLKS